MRPLRLGAPPHRAFRRRRRQLAAAAGAAAAGAAAAADDDARQGPDLLLLDAEERSARWLGACGVAEDRSPSLPPSVAAAMAR